MAMREKDHEKSNEYKNDNKKISNYEKTDDYKKPQTHLFVDRGNEGSVDAYVLAPGITMSFNQIYTNSWMKGDSSVFSDRMLIINFCVAGRCDVSLTGNRYAIVSENQVCVSNILPNKDFYYPGRLYEGIQLYINMNIISKLNGEDLMTLLGIDMGHIGEVFCGDRGLYIHRMSDAMRALVADWWSRREEPDPGYMRYMVARLLHELLDMPCESETDTYFTRSQISIVREAESIIMQDLSRRITAKEMADRFGISESSFKLYVKGILGDTYLSYFRRKRMEKAAELLESTNMKVIDIANAVGYENQGKFARAFAECYGAAPLEFRRLSK